MIRRSLAGLAGLAALAVLAVAASARADVSPPDRAHVTIQLSVDGVKDVPPLRFFVTNCRAPEEATLEAGTPLVCTPDPRLPVRVFGFREADRIDLIDAIRKGTDGAASKTWLDEKAKYCGELREEDSRFLRSSGVAFVSAKYRLEPFHRTGCKLTRVSATTSTTVPPALTERAAPADTTGVPAPIASTSPAAAAPATSPSTPAASPTPSRSSCSCDLARHAPSSSCALASLLALLARRQRRRERVLPSLDAGACPGPSA